MALIERELKRDKLVAKYAKKHAELKGIASDMKRSEEERAAARLGLQKLPRNANPTRQRNRCAITGRPRGTFQHFGLGRAKIREMAFAGEIPGIVKASWYYLCFLSAHQFIAYKNFQIVCVLEQYLIGKRKSQPI